MSTVRTYTINVTSIVEIKILTKTEIEKIISDSIKMIMEKLERIKNHFSSCSFNFINNCLIISDDLNIVSDVEELLNAYGMTTLKVINKKGGSLYLVSDPLFEILGILDFNLSDFLKERFSFEISVIALIKGKEELKRLVSKESVKLNKNSRLKELIDKAKKNEKMMVEKVDLVRVNDRDGYTQRKEVLSSTSLENEYRTAINDLNEFISTIDKSHKSNIVKGTTKSLELKAKKMGYSVEKKIVEDKVQLVLVRSR